MIELFLSSIVIGGLSTLSFFKNTKTTKYILKIPTLCTFLTVFDCFCSKKKKKTLFEFLSTKKIVSCLKKLYTFNIYKNVLKYHTFRDYKRKLHNLKKESLYILRDYK